MLSKLKNWIILIGVTAVGFLLAMLRIKNKKIETLKSDLQKEVANNNVNKGSVDLLEKQIEQERQLNNTPESYNNIVEAFNENK